MAPCSDSAHQSAHCIQVAVWITGSSPYGGISQWIINSKYREGLLPASNSLALCQSVCPSVCHSVCLSVCYSLHRTIWLCVSLSICHSVCLSVCYSLPQTIWLCVSLSVRLSVILSVCQSVRLSVCVSVCPSVSLSVSLLLLASNRPALCQSVCPSVSVCISLSFCQCVCQSVRLSVCVSVCPSVSLVLTGPCEVDGTLKLQEMGQSSCISQRCVLPIFHSLGVYSEDLKFSSVFTVEKVHYLKMLKSGKCYERTGR